MQQYTEIEVSEEGFINLISRNGETTKRTAFLMITPSMTIATEPAGRNLGSKHTLIIKSNNEEYAVVYGDLADMEAAADDLREAMIARIAHRGVRYRPERALRNVDIILLNEACQPVRRTEGSAGYDCKVDQEALKGNNQLRIRDNILTLDPGQFFLAPLGFKLYIADPDFEAQLRPRSGKGSKGLVLGNMIGTIDSDYQGQYMACLWNRLDKPLEVDLDEPVCQMVFNRVEHPAFNAVDEFELTRRGEGGFGSTDKKVGK